MPLSTTTTADYYHHQQQSDAAGGAHLPNGNNGHNTNDHAVPAPQPNLFKPIGTIRTVFPEKRAVPRQPTVGQQLTGTIELSSGVFTNPEHAIDGLQQFSHMWIIYHFHRNAPATHAKVEPPRLRGERVGVFSTRSPHRPSPIGLSLVEILRIDGRRIDFRGTDMVDGTPVLDIKPYIPRYDAPAALLRSGGCAAVIGLQTQQRQSNGEPAAAASLQRGGRLSSREEPDGEESADGIAGAGAAAGAVGGAAAGAADGDDDGNARNDVEGNSDNGGGSIAVPVRVPDWIMDEPTLEVLFNERAEAELTELGIDRVSDVMG